MLKKTECFLCKKVKLCKEIELYYGVVSHDDGNLVTAWVCSKCLLECEEWR